MCNKNTFRIFKPNYEHSHGSNEFPNQCLVQIGQRVRDLKSEIQKERLLLYIFKGIFSLPLMRYDQVTTVQVYQILFLTIWSDRRCPWNLPMLPPGYPWVSLKNVRPFGPAVWPAIGNIYRNVLFYYIDDLGIKKDFYY